MKPKKQSSANLVIYGLCLIFVLYIALHGAIVYVDIERLIEAGEILESQQVLIFMDLLSERLAVAPLSFKFTKYTKDWLTYGGFGWLIIVLAIESNKKNYIQGKTYGTARWGTKADIQDLFASNLEAEEIKRAKRTRTPLGRWLARSGLYKQCENDGQEILKARLNALQEREEERKLDGTADKTLYKEQQAQIKKEVKEEVALAKRQAWYPDQLKLDLKAQLKEIDESQLYSEEEKANKRKDAKEAYDKKLHDFYNNAKRIAKIKAKYKDADMHFTRTERISFYNWKLNQNTLILGGSGSGKTRGFVMPSGLNLLILSGVQSN